nr:hypothetical protein [Tanacetum cinerariifolium]
MRVIVHLIVEKKIGRRFGKEIALEEVNNKSIDVNDEDSDDDFVDSPFGLGLRRSGRNKNKEVCEPHNATTMASGSKGLYVVHNFDEHKMEIKLARGSLVITKELIGDMLGIKNEGINILDGTPVRDNEMQAFINVVEEVERTREKENNLAFKHRWDDFPSFSLNVTQDFELTPVINNEKHVFTPMPIRPFTPKGEDADVLVFYGMGKVTKFLFETPNLPDTDLFFKDNMEDYKSDNSPLRLFLPIFVVDKDNFSVVSNDDGRFRKVVEHVESVTRRNIDLEKLKKIDIVFLPVDNEGHRFLVTFDLKYGEMTLFDQKKKEKARKK